jgi:phosphatidylserine decarboxylase
MIAAYAHHLPKSNEGLSAFHRDLGPKIDAVQAAGAAQISSPAVQALAALIDADAIVRMFTVEMIRQAIELPQSPDQPAVKDVDDLLSALDLITTLAPAYNVNKNLRNAFPMSSLFGYMMMTPAGESIFRNRSFNAAIQKILQEWCAYLNSGASTSVLTTDADGWLSPPAVKEFQLDDFIHDPNLPHWGWTSYNDFFHRQIKPEKRPVASPNDPKVIVSANDGNLVSIARGVQRMDEFWLKGEPFSLVDMLDHSEYVDQFVGGDVVQVFLSGGNYHRWHSPIDGTVRDARIVDGLMFSDAESAGWDPSGVLSEGYYAAVNTRGLVFVESDDPTIGMVCVIPIGITEISSVTIEVAIGQKLAKGDELGYFSYGGSSLCLVFKQGAIDEFTMGDPPPKPVTDPTSGPAVEVNAQIALAN